MPDYDPDLDSYGCWQLGIQATREKRIRLGEIEPDPSRQNELRWRQEGPRAPHDLDAVRG